MTSYSSGDSEHDSDWISVSDLMAGLMVIFMFIAISYMINVINEKEEIRVQRDNIRSIAVTYNRLQDELYDELQSEFEDSLASWQAVVDRETLAIRFEAPRVLFFEGSSRIRPRFSTILSDFFPRYIAILASPKYRGDIEEIRIEGHTSSEWNWGTSLAEAYIENMELSQDRAREVLTYALSLPSVAHDREWIRRHLTANGLSSSKRVLSDSGSEDQASSRRVEFRVRTNAERQIMDIIEAGGIISQ